MDNTPASFLTSGWLLSLAVSSARSSLSAFSSARSSSSPDSPAPAAAAYMRARSIRSASLHQIESLDPADVFMYGLIVQFMPSA